jgi:hypothetical protein
MIIAMRLQKGKMFIKIGKVFSSVKLKIVYTTSWTMPELLCAFYLVALAKMY